MCGLSITVHEGRIREIRGDPDDPFSRGHISPQGAALGELREDPDRLETPLIRGRDGRLRPATWDEALGLVARRIRQIQDEHGHDSVAIYLGNDGATARQDSAAAAQVQVSAQDANARVEMARYDAEAP